MTDSTSASLWPEKIGQDERQCSTPGIVRYVLIASLVLAVIGLLLAFVTSV